MSLPTSSKQLFKLFKKGNRHPAMKMASTALKMKRSPNQVFLLLVGLTGAGKSSTINYLFDKTIAPTGETESITRSTDEFVVTMESEEWKIPDLRLSVIDTPGFCDTKGLEQDAANVLSIKRFFDEHDGLRGCFPNIVFVVLSIIDNRIGGTDSQFAKMLRGLRYIKAVDYNNPNVVVVLTHAAGIAINPKKWNEKANNKKIQVKAIVELNLGITPDIVFQENLPDDFDLDKIDDWHILPNGEKQPKTLYKACEQILNTSNDEIGHEAMAVCFRPGKKKPVVKGLTTSASDIDKDDVDEMYSNLLQASVMIAESEVGNMLERYRKSQNSVEFQNDILLLQVRLRDIDIKSANDIQSLTLNTLVSKMYPLRLNRNMEKIVEQVFGIQYEQLSGYDYHIGFGYDIFRDTKTTMQPLVLSDTGETFGQPDNVLLRGCSSYDIKCQAIKTTEEYIKERLRDVGINVEGLLKYELFNMKMQDGYNMNNSDSSAKSQTTNRFTFWIEQKTRKVEIKKPFKLNPELVKDLKALPDNYSLKNEDNVNRWKAFFEKWGYYVITGAYIGGSLSGQVLTSKTQSTERACENAQMDLALRLSYLQNKGGFDVDTNESQNSSQTSSVNIQSTSMQWNGGDKALYRNSLDNITFEDWKRWTESLEYAPAALWTSLDVYPMYLLAAEINQEKSTAMQSILNLALAGNFYYKPPKPTPIASYSPPPINVSYSPQSVSQSPPIKNTREEAAPSKKNEDDGCFHPMSTVSLSNGESILIKDLTIGDHVLTLDYQSRVVEDVIISWIHKKTEGIYNFLNIIHNKGHIRLTQEHIVFVGTTQTPYLASSIKPGDKLVYIQTKSSREKLPILVTVLSVTEIVGTGIYAPLTKSGRLMVNGIAASCYCTLNPITVLGKEIISSHSLAHLGFLPMRIAHYVGATTIPSQMDEESGISSYAKWLRNMFLDNLQ